MPGRLHSWLSRKVVRSTLSSLMKPTSASNSLATSPERSGDRVVDQIGRAVDQSGGDRRGERLELDLRGERPLGPPLGGDVGERCDRVEPGLTRHGQRPCVDPQPAGRLVGPFEAEDLIDRGPAGPQGRQRRQALGARAASRREGPSACPALGRRCAAALARPLPGSSLALRLQAYTRPVGSWIRMPSAQALDDRAIPLLALAAGPPRYRICSVTSRTMQSTSSRSARTNRAS